MRSLQNVVAAIAPIIALWPTVVLPAMAEPPASALRQGLPGRRISGGSRGDCVVGTQPMVALTPPSHLSLTASDSPSLHFAVATFEQTYPAEFSLRDRTGQVIYQKTVEIDKDQDILSIQLPAQTLAADQLYRWNFAVVCDEAAPFSPMMLTGWLRQVEVTEAAMAEPSEGIAAVAAIHPENHPENHPESTATEETQISAALAQIDRAQSAGFWADAIAQLVALRRANPDNPQVTAAWNQAVEALNLANQVTPSVATR